MNKLYYTIFQSVFTQWPHWNKTLMDWSVSLFSRERSQIPVEILPIHRIIIWVLISVRIKTNMQIAAVLTYLYTSCFRLRASDWSSNIHHRKCRYLPFNRNCPVSSASWGWILFEKKVLSAEFPQKIIKYKNFFVTVSWHYPVLRVGGFMALWFYFWEHLKAQPAVVLI